MDEMIGRMNAEPLAFAVHVGDITSGNGPCGDEWLEARKRQFARVKAPFVLLPGDNEWTDCHRTGFDPLERLEKWRELFCVPVQALSLERQQGKYCEHVRWIAQNVVFVGLNIPGSNNNLPRDPLEHRERMQAALAWLDEAVECAKSKPPKKRKAKPHRKAFVTPERDAGRQKKFRTALEEGNRRYGKALKKLAE